MSGVIQAEFTRTDLSLEFTDRLPRTILNGDPSIDDPVNDTGLTPDRGDLQMSEELDCLLRMILRESGEFS